MLWMITIITIIGGGIIQVITAVAAFVIRTKMKWLQNNKIIVVAVSLIALILVIWIVTIRLIVTLIVIVTSIVQI